MPCPPAPCQAVQGWFWGSAARALPQPPLILPKLINEQQQIVNLIDVLQLEVNIIVIPTRSPPPPWGAFNWGAGEWGPALL